MPDFRIVNPVDPITFEDAKGKMCAELREALMRAFARARLPEDDPLYSVLFAQAELLNAGFEAQSRLLNGTLKSFVSDRQAENKKVAALFAESIASIKQATKSMHESRVAAENEIYELRASASDVQTAANKAKDAVQTLSRFRADLVAWSVIIAFFGGAVFTFALLTFFGRIH